jgi:dynein heavy chain
MITTSKMYITDNYTQTIWSQDQTIVISKLRDCIKLNEEYQRCFQLTKTKLASNPSERPFDFSEMYIFGKFDSFVRRCERIIDMFATINLYSHLADSKIEGISPFYSKFNMIITSMKKKDYDFLDQRKQDVDSDLDDFRRSIADLHANINEFLDKYFNAIRNTERALNALKRFEKLQLPNIGLNEKYAKILQQYSKDLDSVAKIYQKHSKEPLISRDLPPIAGKICCCFYFIFRCIKLNIIVIQGRITWARQLYMRIQQPMDVFAANKTILQYPGAKKIIKNYNELSKVLISYEILYHEGWRRQVNVVSTGIHSSILICVNRDDPQSAGATNATTTTPSSSVVTSTSKTNPEYLVNFDPNIFELIRETQCLARLGLEIPKEAAILAQREDILKKHYQDLSQLVEKNKRLREKIKQPFEALLTPKIQRLNDIIKLGLTSLTWVSLTIDDFIDTVRLNSLRIAFFSIYSFK